MLFLFSPLEQFEIFPIFNIGVTLTNQFLSLVFLVTFIVGGFYTLVKSTTKSLYVIPNYYQLVIEGVYLLILKMVTTNIKGSKSERFFPLIFSIFFTISAMNLIGLIPYSFTITSHLVITLTLSLSIFIGMNIIAVKIHGLKFFALFLPAGTSLALAFLLVPVELISYFFKPLSLAIRLFCNMMAGHTLLKVFAGFAWSLSNATGITGILQIIPLIILVPLYGLELGVALIQAFVFSLLTCIYLNDAINLH